MGWTIFYLCLIILIPLSMILVKSASLGWLGFWQAVTAPRALAAYRISLEASFIAALINAVFGLVNSPLGIYTNPSPVGVHSVKKASRRLR